MNAIINKNLADVKDCTIYVTLFPCNECAKFIIQSGITEVVYLYDKFSAKPKYLASKRMFIAAGIKCRYVYFLNFKSYSSLLRVVTTFH